MSKPFKLKSGNKTKFKEIGSSPAQHKVDGSWTGHPHKTKLGKLTEQIANLKKPTSKSNAMAGYARIGGVNIRKHDNSLNWGKHKDGKSRYSISANDGNSRIAYEPRGGTNVHQGLQLDIKNKKGKSIFSTKSTVKGGDYKRDESGRRYFEDEAQYNPGRVTKIFGKELKKIDKKKSKETQKKLKPHSQKWMDFGKA